MHLQLQWTVGLFSTRWSVCPVCRCKATRALYEINKTGLVQLSRHRGIELALSIFFIQRITLMTTLRHLTSDWWDWSARTDLHLKKKKSADGEWIVELKSSQARIKTLPLTDKSHRSGQKRTLLPFHGYPMDIIDRCWSNRRQITGPLRGRLLCRYSQNKKSCRLLLCGTCNAKFQQRRLFDCWDLVHLAAVVSYEQSPEFGCSLKEPAIQDEWNILVMFCFSVILCPSLCFAFLW